MYYNPYIVIPLATWIIAQTIKFCVAAFRGQLDLKYLYASGGMPSVHSAVVCSLVVTSLLVDGASSHLFGFIVLFAAIVMYDSFGVRRSAGEQAVALNMIVSSLNRDRIKIQEPDLKLREVLGHNPAEVSVGALLGLVLGCLFNISHLSAQLTYLSALPNRHELIGYAAFFAIVLVGGLVIRVLLSQRYKNSKVVGGLGRQILTESQSIGWLGIVAAFGQYQRLPYLEWRAWSWLLIGIMIFWSLVLTVKYWGKLPEALASEREEQRKRKWFAKKPKKKSRTK